MKKKTNDKSFNVGDRVGIYFDRDGEVGKLQYCPNHFFGVIYGEISSIKDNLHFILWDDHYLNSVSYIKSVYGRGFEASELHSEKEIQQLMPQLEKEYKTFEKKMSMKIELIAKAIEELGGDVKSSGYDPSQMYDLVRPLSSSIRNNGWVGSSFEC